MSAAFFSPDEKYRYGLIRTWDPSTETVTFVMLNPSTADATVDDPTIRRCIGFAKRQGFGGLRVVNLYAFRATDPKVMLREIDPVGPENNMFITTACTGRTVIVAWGASATRERVKEVRELLASAGANVFSLGVTKDGHPRHPLYVRADQPLEPWGFA